MSENYDVRSVPPRYDEYNSYYIYNSEGYEKAVEAIEAEERELTEAEIRKAQEEDLRSVEEDQLGRKQAEEYYRLKEQEILEEIRSKEEIITAQEADISEYEDRRDDPPGTRLDLLA